MREIIKRTTLWLIPISLMLYVVFLIFSALVADSRCLSDGFLKSRVDWRLKRYCISEGNTQAKIYWEEGGALNLIYR